MKKHSYECSHCANKNCLINKHILHDGMDKYLQQKTTFRCMKGQQFILQGAPVSGLFFVYSGQVKVFKTTATAESQIIRLSTAGEIVGHRGFGTSYVYDISATALSDTVMCHFPTDKLVEMLHNNPPLMYDFMLFYADQLQKSESNAMRFAKFSVKEKVINGLLFIERKFGQTDGFFNLILSRKDIADYAGTSQEQVIRVISNLKKEGLLMAKGKKLGIPDIDKLSAQLPESGYFLEG